MQLRGHLLVRGCINGTIHEAARQGLLGECEKLNSNKTGELKVNKASNNLFQITCFIL